ncbi:MAG: DUF167 domain-containing protein [bacterium]
MLVKIRVIPRSKYAEIEELGKDHLRVRVLSPPSDDRANSELIAILARYYNKRKSAIRIKRGLRSRDKLIEVRD